MTEINKLYPFLLGESQKALPQVSNALMSMTQKNSQEKKNFQVVENDLLEKIFQVLFRRPI